MTHHMTTQTSTTALKAPTSVAELEELLTTPSPALVEELAAR